MMEVGGEAKVQNEKQCDERTTEKKAGKFSTNDEIHYSPLPLTQPSTSSLQYMVWRKLLKLKSS